jgi:hypothetical protein
VFGVRAEVVRHPRSGAVHVLFDAAMAEAAHAGPTQCFPQPAELSLEGE